MNDLFVCYVWGLIVSAVAFATFVTSPIPKYYLPHTAWSVAGYVLMSSLFLAVYLGAAGTPQFEGLSVEVIGVAGFIIFNTVMAFGIWENRQNWLFRLAYQRRMARASLRLVET